MQSEYDVIVLGAGASGLMAAWQAAQKGRCVALIDHAGKTGVKLRISGGGRANITNLHMQPECYVGTNPHFCRSALASFTPEMLLDMLDFWGIPWEERDFGQIFCLRPADEFAERLTEACRAQGCTFFMNTAVRAVALPRDDKDDLFTVETDKGRFFCRKLVIALGSPAWPQAGAEDTGARLAKSLGHSIVPFRPALCPLLMPPDWPLQGLAGLSLPVRISPSPAVFPMPLLFTHQGISGPAALTASCMWRPGEELRLDFLPGLSLESVLDAAENGRKKLKNLLKTLLPDRLAERLLPVELAQRNVAELSRKARQQIAAAVHTHAVVPAAYGGMRKAEAAAGGVDTAAFSSSSMESRLVPGLYCIGEVLDVTGMLGGYNLHWAFASAHACARAL